MVSILDTLFGVSLSTDKKDGKQKPKPKMASKNLLLFPPPWAMEHEDSTQFANGESSHQLQPTSVTRTNSAAAIPGQKFSPSLRDIKTWDCRVRTGGGHELVCAFMALLRSFFLLLQCDKPLALASWRTKILLHVCSVWRLHFELWASGLSKSIIVCWVGSKAQKAQITRHRLGPAVANQGKKKLKKLKSSDNTLGPLREGERLKKLKSLEIDWASYCKSRQEKSSKSSNHLK